MNYKEFESKYNYPEIAVMDFIIQKSDLFGDERKVRYISQKNQLYCLTFKNGTKYLGISGRCSLFFTRTVAEAERCYNLIKNNDYADFFHDDQIAFFVFEEGSAADKFDHAILYNFNFLEKEIDSYVPSFYERLIEKLKSETDTASTQIKRNDNTDYSNKSISLTSDAVSKNNLDSFKKIFNDENSKCAFILGNGVSIPFGSDSWEKLINNLIDYLSPFYIKNADGIVKELSKSNYLISSFVRSTFEEKGQTTVFIDGLKYCIYRKYNPEMLKANSLLKAVALAKINKPNLAILTYNYDTFLEQQISECNPSLKYESYSGRDYKKHLDDRIIHLHGTIDSESHDLDEMLVLTDKDYFNAYLSDKNSWVYKAQECVLSEYNCLFIGSSMSDLFQLSIINRVFEQQKRDWRCFALMCFQKELDENDKANLIRFYKSKGIYVIFVNEYGKLASELNEITGNSFSIKKPYYL